MENHPGTGGHVERLVNFAVFRTIILYFFPTLGEQVNLILFKFRHIRDSLLSTIQFQRAMSVNNLVLHGDIVFVILRTVAASDA